MSNNNLGVLWGKKIGLDQETPFNDENSDNDYAKYTEIAEQKGLNLYFSHYKQYNEGELKKAWYWNGEEWTKEENIVIEAVYDKFPYDESSKKVKEKIKENLKILNNPELEKICKDKLRTANIFSDISPETREASEDNIRQMLKEYDKVVLKPVYGYGGKEIKIVDSFDSVSNDLEPENYIVQQFVKSQGISELGIDGHHDLRILLIDNEPVYGYVRVPDEGYISNVGKGGDIIYFDLENIPSEFLEIVDDVRKEFEKFDYCVYSVDMIRSEEDDPFLIELNSKPGITFSEDVANKEYELPTIRKLISNLKAFSNG